MSLDWRLAFHMSNWWQQHRFDEALNNRLQPVPADNRQQPQGRAARAFDPAFPFGHEVLRDIEVAREDRLRDAGATGCTTSIAVTSGWRRSWR